MPDLKPCPFCGGEAQIDGIGNWRWGKCTVCLAQGATRDGEKLATEAWNRRAGEEDKRD